MTDAKFDPKKHVTKLKGKEYIEVRWRIVWFRSEVEGGSIQTELIHIDPVVVKATIIQGDGHVLATGYGTASTGGSNAVWKGREIEKAETAAIGRALAHAGYGTQFTGEDESHLADSPIERKPAPPVSAAPKPVTATGIEAWNEQGTVTEVGSSIRDEETFYPTMVTVLQDKKGWFCTFKREGDAFYTWSASEARKAFPEAAEWFTRIKKSGGNAWIDLNDGEYRLIINTATGDVISGSIVTPASVAFPQ